MIDCKTVRVIALEPFSQTKMPLTCAVGVCRVQEQLGRLASALRICLLPDAEALANMGAVSLLGIYPT